MEQAIFVGKTNVSKAEHDTFLINLINRKVSVNELNSSHLNLIETVPSMTEDSMITLTKSTNIITFSKEYNLIFLVDVSNSMATIEAVGQPKSLFSVAFETICKCLDGITRTLIFKESTLKPDIHVTVIVDSQVNGDSEFQPRKILVQEFKVTRENLLLFIDGLYSMMNQFEDEQKRYLCKEKGGKIEMTSIYDSLSLGISAMRAMKRRQTSLIVITDAVGAGSEVEKMVSMDYCRIISKELVIFTVIQVASPCGFYPAVNFGHVPFNEFVRFISLAANGKFLYSSDCEYMTDEIQSLSFFNRVNFYHLNFLAIKTLFEIDSRFSLMEKVHEMTPRTVDIPKIKVLQGQNQVYPILVSSDRFPWSLDSNSPECVLTLYHLSSYSIRTNTLSSIVSARLLEGYSISDLQFAPKQKSTRIIITFQLDWLPFITIFYRVRFHVHDFNRPILLNSIKNPKVDINLLAHQSFAVALLNFEQVDNVGTLTSALFNTAKNLYDYLKSLNQSDELFAVVCNFQENVKSIQEGNDQQFLRLEENMNRQFSGGHLSTMFSDANQQQQHYFWNVFLDLLTSKMLSFEDINCDLILRSTSSTRQIGHLQTMDQSLKNKRQVATIYLLEFLNSWSSLCYNKFYFLKFEESVEAFVLLSLNWENDVLITLNAMFYNKNYSEKQQEMQELVDGISQIEHYIKNTGLKINPIVVCEKPVRLLLSSFTDPTKDYTKLLSNKEWIFECEFEFTAKLLFQWICYFRTVQGFISVQELHNSLLFYKQLSCKDCCGILYYLCLENNVVKCQLLVEPYVVDASKCIESDYPIFSDQFSMFRDLQYQDSDNEIADWIFSFDRISNILRKKVSNNPMEPFSCSKSLIKLCHLEWFRLGPAYLDEQKDRYYWTLANELEQYCDSTVESSCLQLLHTVFTDQIQADINSAQVYMKFHSNDVLLLIALFKSSGSLGVFECFRPRHLPSQPRISKVFCEFDKAIISSDLVAGDLPAKHLGIERLYSGNSSIFGIKLAPGFDCKTIIRMHRLSLLNDFYNKNLDNCSFELLDNWLSKECYHSDILLSCAGFNMAEITEIIEQSFDLVAFNEFKRYHVFGGSRDSSKPLFMSLFITAHDSILKLGNTMESVQICLRFYGIHTDSTLNSALKLPLVLEDDQSVAITSLYSDISVLVIERQLEHLRFNTDSEAQNIEILLQNYHSLSSAKKTFLLENIKVQPFCIGGVIKNPEFSNLIATRMINSGRFGSVFKRESCSVFIRRDEFIDSLGLSANETSLSVFNYNLIENTLSVYLYSQDLTKFKPLLQELRRCIIQENQEILLLRLLETRKASHLLVKPVQDPDSSENEEEVGNNIFVEGATEWTKLLTILPERSVFACPLQRSHEFEINWRIKPQVALSHVLMSLQALSVVNRKNYLVYSTEDAIYYIEMLVSESDYSSPKMSPKVKNLKSTLKMQIFGISEIGESEMNSLVGLISSKLSFLVQTVLSRFLSRNLGIKLSGSDIDYLFSTRNFAKSIKFSVSNPQMVMKFVREACSKVFMSLAGADTNKRLKEHYFQSFGLDDLKNLDESAFIYSAIASRTPKPLESAIGFGISCFSIALVSGEDPSLLTEIWTLGSINIENLIERIGLIVEESKSEAQVNLVASNFSNDLESFNAVFNAFQKFNCRSISHFSSFLDQTSDHWMKQIHLGYFKQFISGIDTGFKIEVLEIDRLNVPGIDPCGCKLLALLDESIQKQSSIDLEQSKSRVNFFNHDRKTIVLVNVENDFLNLYTFNLSSEMVDKLFYQFSLLCCFNKTAKLYALKCVKLLQTSSRKPNFDPIVHHSVLSKSLNINEVLEYESFKSPDWYSLSNEFQLGIVNGLILLVLESLDMHRELSFSSFATRVTAMVRKCHLVYFCKFPLLVELPKDRLIEYFKYLGFEMLQFQGNSLISTFNYYFCKAEHENSTLFVTFGVAEGMVQCSVHSFDSFGTTPVLTPIMTPQSSSSFLEASSASVYCKKIHFASFSYDSQLIAIRDILKSESHINPINVLVEFTDTIKRNPYFATSRLTRHDLMEHRITGTIMQYIIQNPKRYGFQPLYHENKVVACYISTTSPDFEIKSSTISDYEHTLVIHPCSDSDESDSSYFECFVLLIDLKSIFPTKDPIEPSSIAPNPLEEYIHSGYYHGDLVKKALKRVKVLVEQAILLYSRDSVWNHLVSTLTSSSQENTLGNEEFDRLLIEQLSKNSRQLESIDSQLVKLFSLDANWNAILEQLNSRNPKNSRLIFEKNSGKYHLIILNPMSNDYALAFVPQDTEGVSAFAVSREGIPDEEEYQHINHVVREIIGIMFRS